MMILFSALSGAFAETHPILEAIQQSQQWSDQTQQIQMVITGKRTPKEYNLITHLKRTPETLYAHAQFLQPSTVQNTQIIIVNHNDAADEMWLFLPALNRVTVLKDDNRQRAFMGSDFAFDDFLLWDIPQTHTILSETSDALTVSIQPTDKTQISYSKWDVTIDKLNMQASEILFYKGSEPHKKMTMSRYSNGYPHHLVMTNLQDASTTTIDIQSMDINTQIPLSTFSKDALLPSKEQP